MKNMKREYMGNKQNMGDVDLTRLGRVCVSRLFYLLEQTLFKEHIVRIKKNGVRNKNKKNFFEEKNKVCTKMKYSLTKVVRNEKLQQSRG